MKDKGFTLVELMIVIAIIGMLTAVLIPLLVGRDDISTVQEDSVEVPLSDYGNGYDKQVIIVK